MISLIVCSLLLTPITLDRIVAIVGDQPILHSEVTTLLLESGYSISDDYTEVAASRQYQNALEELVEEGMLIEAARISGQYPTDEQIQGLVDDEISRILEANSADEYYLEYLFSMGVSPDEVPADQEDAIRAQLGSVEFLDEYLTAAGMTMAEYRSFLADFLGDRQAAQSYVGLKVQSALMNMPLSPMTYLSSSAGLVEEIVMPRHLAWIYLPIIPSGSDLDQAVAEILLLRNRILSGESFEELAMEFSEDGSASQGGSLGIFGPGQMVPIFESAVNELEKGEISYPVVTSFGVHLIRLDERYDDGTFAASHILILVPIQDDDVTNTLEFAGSLRDSLSSRNGMTFEDAVAEYSMDLSSKDIGGDLGTVPLSFWPMNLSSAVSELEPGDISDPVVLSDAGAVVLVRRYDDSGEIDWSMYSDEELDGIVQQVIYQDAYSSLIDSLTGEIPVIYTDI